MIKNEFQSWLDWILGIWRCPICNRYNSSGFFSAGRIFQLPDDMRKRMICHQCHCVLILGDRK